MSTISNERLEKLSEYDCADRYEVMSMATELLALRKEREKAEPVAYMIGGHYLMHANDPKVDNYSSAVPLYTAPPAPVVPGDWLPYDPQIAEYEQMMEAEQAQADTTAQQFDSLVGKSMSGWIPCSERMPEEGGRYLCYVEEINSLGKSHYQWNCSWNGDVWGGEALYGRVTHWQPLPEPPCK
ncbi:DUF551 domain-containing protein [Cronobacter turicensis]|uniref:DUF551 domain-containing protein n=1 Tax=Cronobacter turicensis TaxID=413502 RepID=UPI0035709751